MSRSPDAPFRRTLRRLFAEKGIDRYALFLLQQEGKELPGGFESASGFVLIPTGEVYGFWLDWDRRGKRYVLKPWYRVENPSEFSHDPEYLRAHRDLEAQVTDLESGDR